MSSLTLASFVAGLVLASPAGADDGPARAPDADAARPAEQPADGTAADAPAPAAADTAEAPGENPKLKADPPPTGLTDIVPEPVTLWLLLDGCALYLLRRRRRRRRPRRPEG